jgi:tRNA threonylcarbamoyladenosine biosynthesis protein TsaB
VNLLGIDTSTAATSVCIMRADGIAFETIPDLAALDAPPGHAAELLPAVAGRLEAAELDFTDLDAVAVGVGPGTFTGLRIGVASARALAGSLAIELRPVSSLAALAEGIHAPVRLPLIDARRGQLFAALYDDSGLAWPPSAVEPARLVAGLAERTGSAPMAAGDGSLRFCEVLEDAGVEVAPADSDAHVVRALHVCRLAMDTPPAAPETVVPEYLREPDAKPSG